MKYGESIDFTRGKLKKNTDFTVLGLFMAKKHVFSENKAEILGQLEARHTQNLDKHVD
jgi:hypothetical protein